MDYGQIFSFEGLNAIINSFPSIVFNEPIETYYKHAGEFLKYASIYKSKAYLEMEFIALMRFFILILNIKKHKEFSPYCEIYVSYKGKVPINLSRLEDIKKQLKLYESEQAMRLSKQAISRNETQNHFKIRDLPHLSLESQPNENNKILVNSNHKFIDSPNVKNSSYNESSPNYNNQLLKQSQASSLHTNHAVYPTEIEPQCSCSDSQVSPPSGTHSAHLSVHNTYEHLTVRMYQLRIYANPNPKESNETANPSKEPNHLILEIPVHENCLNHALEPSSSPSLLINQDNANSLQLSILEQGKTLNLDQISIKTRPLDKQEVKDSLSQPSLTKGFTEEFLSEEKNSSGGNESDLTHDHGISYLFGFISQGSESLPTSILMNKNDPAASVPNNKLSHIHLNGDHLVSSPSENKAPYVPFKSMGQSRFSCTHQKSLNFQLDRDHFVSPHIFHSSPTAVAGYVPNPPPPIIHNQIPQFDFLSNQVHIVPDIDLSSSINHQAYLKLTENSLNDKILTTQPVYHVDTVKLTNPTQINCEDLPFPTSPSIQESHLTMPNSQLQSTGLSQNQQALNPNLLMTSQPLSKVSYQTSNLFMNNQYHAPPFQGIFSQEHQMYDNHDQPPTYEQLYSKNSPAVASLQPASNSLGSPPNEIRSREIIRSIDNKQYPITQSASTRPSKSLELEPAAIYNSKSKSILNSRDSFSISRSSTPSTIFQSYTAFHSMSPKHMSVFPLLPNQRPLQGTFDPSLKPLQLNSQILDTFVQYSHDNTSHNIETCGILAGRVLGRNKIVFQVTHLIIPKQTASSDSCGTTDENEIFDYQVKHDILTLGWIHTHPSQACFLSSIDLHTQYCYQNLFPEALAIVIAQNDIPIFSCFRLTPTGLKVIQSCRQKGFHYHGESALYETCAHVDMKPNGEAFEVMDMR